MSDSNDKYWLNSVLDTIEEKYPDGEIIVSSGITPSADYHIGHFREILSAEIIKVGLELRGRKARHIHVVDNFDPLRKRYDFLPEEYEKYVGWPVSLVPAPDGSDKNYADYFFDIFKVSIDKLNITAEIVSSYRDLYKSGKMAPQIEKAVDHVEEIKKIFKEVSNRDLADDWMPLQLMDDSNSFKNELRFKSLDKENKQLLYVDKNGNEGSMPYNDGQVKLNWRLDWPARWELLGVMVEPHGFQEHGASGGSYETGLRFAKTVFGIEGPIAGIQYGHIHLKGDSKKMSSSLGNLITPDEAFKMMPPEMLRYFYARYPGKKRIDFDPGIGFLRMMDEFSSVANAVANGEDHEFASAFKIAVANAKHRAVPTIPFNHLVSLYQTAVGDSEQVLNILRSTEGEELVNDQKEAIERALGYVKYWLENYAPEDVKFELQDKLPEVDLSESQKNLLKKFSETLQNSDEKSAEWFHSIIHELRGDDLSPKEAFEAIYLSLIGKTSGPRAGWFLSILDRDLLIKRFSEAANS